MSISQTTVGWLLLAAAALTFVAGFVSRTFIGRRRNTKAVRGLVRTFRKTGVARVLFGPDTPLVTQRGDLVDIGDRLRTG